KEPAEKRVLLGRDPARVKINLTPRKVGRLKLGIVFEDEGGETISRGDEFWIRVVRFQFRQLVLPNSVYRGVIALVWVAGFMGLIGGVLALVSHVACFE